MRMFLVACTVALASCEVPQSSVTRPFVGPLPQDARVDLAGTFTLTAKGELRLALVRPCALFRDKPSGAGVIVEACKQPTLDAIAVVARAPWNQQVRGTWSGPMLIVFTIDWKSTGIDPLAEDAAALAGRPWTVSGTRWAPRPEDTQRMIQLIGAATETETELVRGGPPPSLEVTRFDIEGETLRAGSPSRLVVRIANHGQGAAYRVVATTRSSIESLHGKRLSFGMIRAGAEKARELTLALPVSEAAHDTMLVLAFAEANGAVPHHVSRRIPIAPSDAAPVLAVRCLSEGRSLVRPDVDAGQRLPLTCTVENTGDADAKQVELEVSVVGGTPTRFAPRPIAASRHTVFDMLVNIPRALPIDAPVQITITARDRVSSRAATTALTGVVRKPRLCVPGQLTRAQYRAKIDELRSAVSAGDLSQAAFDRFDAELVSCLK